MFKKVIVVISAHLSNRPTIASSTAGRELYQFIKRKYPDVEVHFIPNEENIHEKAGILRQYAKKGNVLFAYYGHGKREKLCGAIPPHCGIDTLTGRDRGGMVDPRNVDVLNNIITYGLCCWSSLTLGRLAEQIGARSYVSFRAPVYVGFNLTEAPYMDYCIDIWQQFPKVLLDGGTVAEGIRAFCDKTRNYIDLFERNKDKWLYAEFYKLRFQRNVDIMMPFGDLRAKLVGER